MIFFWVCANELFQNVTLNDGAGFLCAVAVVVSVAVNFLVSLFVIFCIFCYLLQSRVLYKWGYSISFQLKCDWTEWHDAARYGTPYSHTNPPFKSFYCSISFFVSLYDLFSTSGAYFKFLVCWLFFYLEFYFLFFWFRILFKKATREKKNSVVVSSLLNNLKGCEEE